MYNLQSEKRRIRIDRKLVYILLAIMAILMISAAVGWYVWDTHTVRTVYVEGNVHYTEDQIKDLVMGGVFGKNSLYLSMKYKNQHVENIPFLAAMDVKILTPDSIKITVYEKALAGYVKYMDTYVYFDKDGYVVESSAIRTAGIPQVTGLEFDYIVLGQPLPVKEEYQNVFGTILDLTKLLNKYQLSADRIYFHADSRITLYFGTVKVALGNETDRLEDKLMRISSMLEKLGEKRGTIQMEAYNEEGVYSFNPE